MLVVDDSPDGTPDLAEAAEREMVVFEHARIAFTTRRDLVQRLVRCMSVSVVSTVICLTTLVVATAGLGVAAWSANIMATAIATIPSYHLNRRWTWGRHGASNVWREVVPFWALAFAGLALSTVAVGIADAWAAGAHLAGPLRTMTVLVAHLSGFGVLWIVQFVLLDRVLFGRSASTTG